MEKYRLKGSCAIYIITLYRFPEGLTSAKLSEISGRNKAEVSREISAMLAEGIVAREDGGKKYRANIVLTEKGRLAAEELAKIADEKVKAVSGNLQENNIEILYSSLETISVNLASVADGED